MPPENLPHFHVITPGDHFSPRTGSAVPTVVDGLCRATPPDAPRPRVVIAKGTYSDRYDSAEIVEYVPDNRRLPAQRYVDVLAGRVGLARPGAIRAWRAAMRDQDMWPPSYVIGHNGPQLMRCVDASRHQSVLYAHNELLRSYAKRELNATLGSVSKIICVSDFLAEQTSAGLPPRLADRVRVVPNGVDCAQFHPRTDEATTGDLTVMFVGRTTPFKGADVLLRAAALADRTSLRYLVVGSHGFDPDAALTEYETSLRRLAQGTRSSVEFVATVPRTRLPDHLRTADLLVVPSRWDEPSGLTVGEGMATGITVIASAAGGIPEVLGDAGVLVPPDDPQALADVLIELADNPAKRHELGQAARQRALKHDWAWSRRLLDEALAD